MNPTKKRHPGVKVVKPAKRCCVVMLFTVIYHDHMADGLSDYGDQDSRDVERLLVDEGIETKVPWDTFAESPVGTIIPAYNDDTEDTDCAADAYIIRTK